MSNEPEPILGKCRRCGGGVFYRRSIAFPGRLNGPWLHAYAADWVDDAHNVEPDDAAQSALAAARADQEATA